MEPLTKNLHLCSKTPVVIFKPQARTVSKKMQGGEGQITTEQTEQILIVRKLLNLYMQVRVSLRILKKGLKGWLWGVKLKALGNRLRCIVTPPDCFFYLMGMQTSPPWRLQKAVYKTGQDSLKTVLGPHRWHCILKPASATFSFLQTQVFPPSSALFSLLQRLPSLCTWDIYYFSYFFCGCEKVHRAKITPPVSL